MIKDAAESYMDDRSKRLRESTLEGYRSSLSAHVLPHWGHVPIEEITPEDLQDWVDTRFPGIPGGAEKAFKTLRQVVRYAIRKLGVRCWDPTTAGIELPKKNRYRAKTLDASGVRSYLRALWGDATEAVAICAVTLGLRRGEACGLRWSDIDMRTGEVRIRFSESNHSGAFIASDGNSTPWLVAVSTNGSQKLGSATAQHEGGGSYLLAVPRCPSRWQPTRSMSHCLGQGCAPRPCALNCRSCRRRAARCRCQRR